MLNEHFVAFVLCNIWPMCCTVNKTYTGTPNLFLRQQLLLSLQLYRMSQQVLQVLLPVSHGDLQRLEHIVAHFTIFVFDEV